MNINFPFQFSTLGTTGGCDDPKHIRDLIEQLIFTSPGERVNRPEFGSGVLQSVFAPNSIELAGTIQFLIQGAIQQYLGDLIQIESVEVENEDATLHVTVKYMILRTQQNETANFNWE